METDIQPMRGKSMLDVSLEAKVMQGLGIHIDDVEPGQTLQYLDGVLRYFVTKQDAQGRSQLLADQDVVYPVVTAGRAGEDGEVTEQITGLFIGVSVAGV